MDHFMNEIIDAILQFCKFFHLSQNDSHLEANQCRKTFKVMVEKGMGIITSYILLIRPDENKSK